MLQQSQSVFLILQEKASYNTEDGKLLLQLNTLPISQYLFLSTYLKLTGDCAFLIVVFINKRMALHQRNVLKYLFQ